MLSTPEAFRSETRVPLSDLVAESKPYRRKLHRAHPSKRAKGGAASDWRWRKVGQPAPKSLFPPVQWGFFANYWQALRRWRGEVWLLPLLFSSLGDSCASPRMCHARW